MQRVKSQEGTTRIPALMVLALVLSYLTYQLLRPIDDPSLDGPRVTVAPVPNSDGVEA